VPIVDPTTESWRKKMRVSSAGAASPLVAPETTSVPPGRSDLIEWLQVAGADRLEDRVDPLGHPRARLEDCVGAERQRLVALVLRPARGPHAQAAGGAEDDRGGGHAAARALHEHGGARCQAGAREEHPVGGQPRRGQAGRLLEGQLGGLGDDVARRHDDALGQRPLVALGQQ
jgi:hypothetical protein